MRMGVLGVAATAVLSMGLVACQEQSRVDADATVTISGQALDPSGAPLAHRPVELRSGISDAELGFAVLSFGTSCAIGACTEEAHDTLSDGEGRFDFELRGRDTQSTFGEARLQVLATSAAPGPGQVSGAAAGAEFRVQTEQIRLPDLQLVDPGLQLTASGSLNLSWTNSAPGPYTITFEAPAPVPVWLEVSESNQIAVDPRVLEDTAGQVVVAGSTADAIEGSDVRLHWRSPGIPYVSGTGAPPSRGRGCTYGEVSPESPCPLTDGDLVTATPAAGEALIHLAEPLPAELVVVRGCPTTCNVDVSLDGEAFSPRGAVSGEHGSVPLGGMQITTVRVTVPADSPGGLREVSVWGPRPEVAPLQAVQEPPADLRQGFGTDLPVEVPDDDDVPVALAALAAVMLLAVAAASGAVFSRGRR